MTASEERHARELERRLAEAEATIEALLSGQIDAVSDSTGKTPVLLAKAQDALRASEERYRRIVETTNEGVWLIDAGNKTTFMNRRMAQILGCEADMGAGRSPDEFLEEAERSSFASHLQLPDAEQTEVRFVRGDGTNVWTLLEATPLLDCAGRYDGSLAMVIDITERRDAQAALRTSTADLVERTKVLKEQTDVLSEQAALLDLVPDAIVVRDMQGRIEFWNRGAEVMYGWLSKEAQGRDAVELLHTGLCGAAGGIESGLLREGQWEGEAIKTKRDGTKLMVASRWTIQCFGALQNLPIVALQK